VATQAWMKCIESDVHDTDASGAITADEVQQCAQQKIDLVLKDAPGLLPPHIVITGNGGAVMKLDDATVAQPEAEADGTGNAAMPVPAVQTSPEVSRPEMPAANIQDGAAQAQNNQTTQPASAPSRTLLDIYNNRDDRRLVTLRMARKSLRIGQDSLDFTLTSNHAGYVYLLMVGSDGQAFDMLFPNRIDGDNYIEQDGSMRLPRSMWQVMAQGPEGEDHLLAIVTDSPRDFSRIGMMPSGPFSTVSATRSSTRNIQVVTGTTEDAACNSDIKSRAGGTNGCSNAYGAALATVEEVK
jgi:Domain of unknown function (DUF4384)